MILVLSLLLGWASAMPTTPEEHAPASGAESPPAEPGAARAGGAPEVEEPQEASEPAAREFVHLLEHGKRLYFDGRIVEAHETLLGLERRLLRGEDVALDTRAETMIWLGEVQYKLGYAVEAREAFRWLLQQDPEWPISPYAHPIEVIGEFELVRRQVQDEIERARVPLPEVAPPPPAPLWTWAPLGLPQIAQKRPGAALIFGGAQIGLGVASLHVAGLQRRDNAAWERNPSGWSEDAARRYQQQKFLVQWPTTFGFYGAWLLSGVEARRHHRVSHRAQATVADANMGDAAEPEPRAARTTEAIPPRPRPRVMLGLGPLPGGANGLVVSGGF